jgi:hypothetical protein
VSTMRTDNSNPPRPDGFSQDAHARVVLHLHTATTDKCFHHAKRIPAIELSLLGLGVEKKESASLM